MGAPPRPHPLTRSRFANNVNRAITTMWAKGWTTQPALEPDALWALGAKGFSHEDEVSIRAPEEVADFRERLDRLCRSLREEADLNALGHTMAYGQLKKAIHDRHALGRLWRRRPDLARTQIAPPIAVIGQMRSGTTRVHRLLAADPRHCGTRFCDSHHPVPASPDLRPLVSRAALAFLRRINPWLDTLHPFGPTRADEEIGWLAAALSPASYEAQWRIPSFVAWSEALDPAPVYAEFARILRTDAAHHDNGDRPRILKCPQFTEDLPALFASIPGIRCIVTHRDEGAVWQSAVSMVACQSAYQSDSITLSEIETEWERKIALREERLSAGLRKVDGTSAAVGFDELNADWQGEIRRLYSELGLTLDDRALHAMTRELDRKSRKPHQSHSRQLQNFDLRRPSQAGKALRAAR